MFDPKYRVKHKVTPIRRLAKQKSPLRMVGDGYFHNWYQHDRVLYAKWQASRPIAGE